MPHRFNDRLICFLFDAWLSQLISIERTRKNAIGLPFWFSVADNATSETSVSTTKGRFSFRTPNDSISGGSRKFWWGGIWSQNLKNSDVFTKIESDFSAEIGNSNVFFAQNQVVSKKIKKKIKKKVFTKIETDFSAEIGNSNVFSPKIRWSPKKKGLNQNWDWFFGRNRKFKRFFRPKSDKKRS